MKFIDEPCALLAEADKLGLLRGAKALAEGGEVDGFEEVGLALRVVAAQKVDSLTKLHIRRGNIPKIGNFYPFADHAVLLEGLPFLRWLIKIIFCLIF